MVPLDQVGEWEHEPRSSSVNIDCAETPPLDVMLILGTNQPTGEIPGSLHGRGLSGGRDGTPCSHTSWGAILTLFFHMYDNVWTG